MINDEGRTGEQEKICEEGEFEKKQKNVRKRRKK
jgi:hypothetical protein